MELCPPTHSCCPNPADAGENLAEGEGFEPSKLSRQIYSLLPLATREPLQLVAYPTTSFPGVKMLFSQPSRPKACRLAGAGFPLERGALCQSSMENASPALIGRAHV